MRLMEMVVEWVGEELGEIQTGRDTERRLVIKDKFKLAQMTLTFTGVWNSDLGDYLTFGLVGEIGRKKKKNRSKCVRGRGCALARVRAYLVY